MFEKIKEQRRILVFFAAIYIVFGSMLAFLLFFTPGLSFAQGQEQHNFGDIFLVNDSIHIINTITVETDSGETIAEIERLAPGEMFKLPVEKTGAIILVARAHYHDEVSSNFTFKGQPGRQETPTLSYRILANDVALIGIEFVAKIDVCNEDTEPWEDFSIEQGHEAEFFEENASKESFSLEAEACESFSFSLTPSQAGQTKIYFNVEGPSYSKKIEREIEIQEWVESA